ncbi:Rhomboid-like protein 9 protein [Thalictrum thalictroides]|uniref:Rhomboid-like protein 9 protein n=1 Tax=Thalictrum thalictroides TaxID=46969 RepID=A0A7J6WD59_THATH|nr:Rhomboid-like protein 9 protein [Thalictrum thalictroides]
MALIPTYSSKLIKDQVTSISISTKLIPTQKRCKCFCLCNGDRRSATFKNNGKMMFTSGLSVICALGNEENNVQYVVRTYNLPTTFYTSESSSIDKQLGELDSYFRKLQNKQETSVTQSRKSDTTIISGNNKLEPSSQISDKATYFKAENELDTLGNYFEKLNAIKLQKNKSTSDEEKQARTPNFVSADYDRPEAKDIKTYVHPKSGDVEPYLEKSQVLQSQEESSELHLVSVFASINIAVFLFEIATPVKNSDLELFTLPSMYGAKINHMIQEGEWWRLLTPMFLHSGILHVALGFWVLLTFGPKVCKGYGSFTFFLIYILGGISGNLLSYIHTPEPTVGGTGPVFAIIGAWLMYQTQNKEVIKKDVSEDMFRKATIATALGFVISSFGEIDDWTHLGAMCIGIAYGFLTCPTLQLDDSSSKNDQKNGVAVARQYADPFKSIVTFAIFIAIFSTLILFVEPQAVNIITGQEAIPWNCIEIVAEIKQMMGQMEYINIFRECNVAAGCLAAIEEIPDSCLFSFPLLIIDFFFHRLQQIVDDDGSGKMYLSTGSCSFELSTPTD